MPEGISKVVLLVLPSLVTAPADALPFLVEGKADVGTAVGGVDWADIVEMVSVAKKLLAMLLLQEGVLSSLSVKLYWPECYRILSPCVLGFVIVVLIYVHRHVLMLLWSTTWWYLCLGGAASKFHQRCGGKLPSDAVWES